MHTVISKLVALNVEKYYVALTEIQLKICRFNGFLSQKTDFGYKCSYIHTRCVSCLVLLLSCDSLVTGLVTCLVIIL